MLSQLTTALAHPFASGIKQYTVTYESIMDALQVFENWVMMQKKLIDIDHRCRQLDIKKLQEYSNFENA